MASVRLFVYGSLKRGERHHKELNFRRARFIGEAETCPGYRLELLEGPDGYLALVGHGNTNGNTNGNTSATGVVRGEVFELDESELLGLDAFEGDAYVRGPVDLLLNGPRENPENPAKPERKSVLALAYFKRAR